MEPSSLFKNFNTLLRHIAAGFVGIGAAWLFAGAIAKCAISALVVHQPIIAIIVATMCGLMVSSIHRSLPYALLVRLVYSAAKHTVAKHAAAKGTCTGRDVIQLDLRRFKRRHPDPKVGAGAAVQRELDNWAAHIHFLYCSGWSVLGAYGYLLSRNEEPYRYAGCIMPSLFLVFLVLALISDWRLTCRELTIKDDGSAAGTST